MKRSWCISGRIGRIGPSDDRHAHPDRRRPSAHARGARRAARSQRFDVCGRPRAARRRSPGRRAPARPRAARPDDAGDGRVDALPRIRKASPSSAVVVLTAAEDEDNLLAAIRAGAAGYLLKSEPPERIVSLLRGIGEGEAALSGPVARRLLEQVREGDGAGRRPARSAPPVARETEVLLLLERHLATDEIAARAGDLRAHGAVAREEPARQARRVVASRGARGARRRAAGLEQSRNPRARPRRAREGAQVVAALEHGGDTRSELCGPPASSRKQSAESSRSARGRRRARRSRRRRGAARARSARRPARRFATLEVPVVAGARRQGDAGRDIPELLYSVAVASDRRNTKVLEVRS